MSLPHVAPAPYDANMDQARLQPLISNSDIGGLSQNPVAPLLHSGPSQATTESPNSTFYWPKSQAVAPMVVLLSFFDGIGTAALALQQLQVGVLLFLAWEIDATCCEVTTRHFPHVQHMGDFLGTPAKQVAAAVQAVTSANPGSRILITGGPPCPDYSPIKGDEAAGMAGQTGVLFQQWTDWLREFEAIVQDTVMICIENVVMKNEWALYFDHALGAKHIVGCASDFRVISRPRLWWTRIRWPKGPLASSHQASEHHALPNTSWTRHGEHARLITAINQQAPEHYFGQFLPAGVRSGGILMPCLTTPAPDERGRSAPK